MESTSHCYNYENCANEHTFLTINPRMTTLGYDLSLLTKEGDITRRFNEPHRY
jgi:hypothetical protein